MGNYRCATMDSIRVILLLLGLCTTAQADGHGVFCTTQFNFWFANNASAETVLLALAEPYNACLTACNMQTNANAKYYQYKELGGLGYPNAGGFDHTCTTPDSSAGNAVPGAPLHWSLCTSLHASACSHRTRWPLSLLGCITSASHI